MGGGGGSSLRVEMVKYGYSISLALNGKEVMQNVGSIDYTFLRTVSMGIDTGGGGYCDCVSFLISVM